MNHEETFKFNQYQKTSEEELDQIKKIISSKLGLEKKSKRGRPPKKLSEKYKPIAIRINPEVLGNLKDEASQLNIGYQTLINKILSQHVASRTNDTIH